MKNWCFWTVVLEKTLKSPLDNKEIKLVNPEGNQPWIFIGRTDVEAPVVWPTKIQLIGKDPDAGTDWGQEEKGMGEDGMVGLHHQINGCESEQTLGDSEGQGSLACCSAWGHEELDMTERLNWTVMFKLLNTAYNAFHCLVHVQLCLTFCPHHGKSSHRTT